MLPCAPRMNFDSPYPRGAAQAAFDRQMLRELIEEESRPEVRELRRRQYEAHQRLYAAVDRYLEQLEADRIAREEWREFWTWPNWVGAVSAAAGLLAAIIFLASPYNPLP